MKKRSAFTFIELIFVLVIMGIIAKYGVEFLAQAYRNYIYQQLTNKLQDTSSAALELIAGKLQYRIKDSVIVRDPGNANWASNFKALEGENNATGYDVLEWIGYDIESFRGNANAQPLWSGIIDKEYAHATPIPTDIYTPGTDTSAVNTNIQVLSAGGSDINDSAIYIMSSDSDVYTDYGWDGVAINDQNHTMHPINASTVGINRFVSANAQNFAALNSALSDARYKLCWSAYAVEFDPNTRKLWLYYDYQPWQGEKYTQGKKVLIMNHVSTFRKRQSFDVIKIQVCTVNEFDDQNASTTRAEQENISICKEKTIY